MSKPHICLEWVKGSFLYDTEQKKKFFNKDSFSKCDQIHRKLRIWSHLLKKSLMEKFTGNYGFGHIYWRNPSLETSFLVQCDFRKKVKNSDLPSHQPQLSVYNKTDRKVSTLYTSLLLWEAIITSVSLLWVTS